MGRKGATAGKVRQGTLAARSAAETPQGTSYNRKRSGKEPMPQSVAVKVRQKILGVAGLALKLQQRDNEKEEGGGEKIGEKNIDTICLNHIFIFFRFKQNIYIFIFYYAYFFYILASFFIILILYHYHPLSSSSFIILILYHPHPLSSSSFIILIFHHRHPLSFSSFIILILYHPHPLSSPSFITLILIILIILVILLILINLKQDMLDGRAAAGIEPGTFSPGAARKLSNVEKQKTLEFSAKWGQHKINFPRNSRDFIGSCSKNPEILNKIDSSKKPKIPGTSARMGEKVKDVLLTLS